MGGVKVGRVNGRFVLNPTLAEQAESDLEITIAGTKDAVTMVEAGANEVPEQAILEAISFGHQFIKELCLWQEEIRAQIGKGKAEVTVFQPALDLDRWVREHVYEELVQALKASEKLERERLLDEVRGGAHEAYQEEFGEEEYEEQSKFIDAVFDAVLKEEVRRAITQDRMRPDGRRPEEIRPVTCQVGLLPRAHGSGLFTRGQTQVLTSVTLGLKSDEQLLDSLTDEESKRYIHHYNFPPYSVGEVRPIRGPGRREIGHGAPAERAAPHDPQGGRVPLHHPPGFRGFGIQRLLVHGQRVRQYLGFDGCRCAH